MRNKKVLKRIFEFAFFALVMYFSFTTVYKDQDLKVIYQNLRTMSVPYLLLSISASVMFVLCDSITIRFLLKQIDSACHFKNCLKYSFIGFFYSGITPSASGGQPMQLYYMKKDNVHINTGFVTLMVIATLNKIVLVLVGFSVLIFGHDILFANLGKYKPLFCFGMTIDVIWVAVLIALMCFTNQIARLAKFILSLFIRRHPYILKRLQRKVDEFAQNYNNSLVFVIKNIKRILFSVVFVFLQRSIQIIIPLLVFRGLGINDVPAITIIILQAAVLVTVELLPIPGAQGITEVMYRCVFSLLIAEQSIVSSMYITRGVNFYMLLAIGAIVSVVCFFTYKKKAAPVETASGFEEVK